MGLDLHGNNGFYAMVDEDGRRLFGKRLPNSLRLTCPATTGNTEGERLGPNMEESLIRRPSEELLASRGDMSVPLKSKSTMTVGKRVLGRWLT